MTAEIFLHPGGRAICPECSGVLRPSADELNCVDCHALYRIKDIGLNDHTVIAAIIWRPQEKEEPTK